MINNKFFELKHKSKKSQARLGVIHTSHGDIATPEFMPVGTQATVKTLDPRDLTEAGAQIILGNAYHLHLRPGENLIKKMGGLAKFMNWHKPTLTDSGGFQVFSLDREFEVRGAKDNQNLRGKSLVKISEDGVAFRSYLDGSWHIFTPESATEIQHKIGADIIMAFDECSKDDAPKDESMAAMERTHRWAKRCLEYHLARHSEADKLASAEESLKIKRKGILPRQLAIQDDKKRNDQIDTLNQHLFGIIQGGKFKDLRIKSAKFITSLPFDGIALGGESVGYNMSTTKKIMSWLNPLLPEDKPRYTMGVGFAPSDLFAVVEMGIDMFDCVAPTRLARNGALYVSPQAGGKQKNKYRVNINNAEFTEDLKPIDPWCTCRVCRGFDGKNFFTRSYLHHLFKTDEMEGLRLGSIHNVHFMLQVMAEIRSAIAKDSFEKLKKEWVK